MAGQTDGPSLWFRQKFLNNCWIVFFLSFVQTFMVPQGWILMTFHYLTFVLQSEIAQRLLDGLPHSLVETLMV